jgi:PAS domain S-box-containing protein
MHDRNADKDPRPRDADRFREIVDLAPEPMGIEREGYLVYANAACLKMLGLADAEAAYRTPLTSLLTRDEPAARALHDLEPPMRQPPRETYRVRRPDGSTRVIEVSWAQVEYDGRPCTLWMGRDVTARKQLEARLVQADRLAALGTMAAGIAHEINNPLAYVMLNLEWIARKLPDVAHDPAALGALTEILEEARQGTERVSAIVRELRSFSAADGDSRHDVDLAAVVESAIEIVSHEIRRHARVSTDLEPAPPVWASKARLEQVVINLLLNAAQSTTEAGAKPSEIRVSVRPEGDAHVVLEVSDDGAGIPQEVQPRIFDPFYSTKPAAVGAGLGLSICHGIVASLGGTITAYSQPGEGATFRVVLPANAARRSDPPGPLTPEESVDPMASTTRAVAQPSARVLVVDDEPQIGEALRELLAPDEVTRVATCREALALLGSDGAFDVVLCNLVMPEMSGIDLFEAIHREHPGLERRIVFMTDGAFHSRAAEFLAGIENTRLEKPFDLVRVERIVREMAAARARGTRRSRDIDEALDAATSSRRRPTADR